MAMHSSLQQLVDDACLGAEKATYTLNKQPGYEKVYREFCSQGSAGASAAVAPVHVHLAGDEYVQGCRVRLASRDRLDCRALSMTTYQAATVSRGNDLRPLRLIHLSCHHLASVRELHDHV